MGGYLVTVTDTDTKNPVANAAVALHKDNSISIRLPNSRLLDYADQTTVTVQLVKDKSAVPGMSIAVTDKNDNDASGKTDHGRVRSPFPPAAVRPTRTARPRRAMRTRTATAGR